MQHQNSTALTLAPTMARGVYRSTLIVRGMVTYFAITSMGLVLDDEDGAGGMRTVRMGTVPESLTVAKLQSALDMRDSMDDIRPPLSVVIHRPASSEPAPF